MNVSHVCPAKWLRVSVYQHMHMCLASCFLFVLYVCPRGKETIQPCVLFLFFFLVQCECVPTLGNILETHACSTFV